MKRILTILIVLMLVFTTGCLKVVIEQKAPDKEPTITSSPVEKTEYIIEDSGDAEELEEDDTDDVEIKDTESKRAAETTKTSTSSTELTSGKCTIFPSDNPWNTDISDYPVHKNSDGFVKSIGRSDNLHPDFGTVWDGGPNGIPYIMVDNAPMVPINFVDYGDESDPGPYPIPDNAPVEHGDDHHVIVMDKGRCKLYELYNADKTRTGWDASSGAVFDLTTNKLRPISWTSADAAGLPIFPGLVKYDEVASGEIDHALRFTVEYSQQAFVLPATHYASDDTDPDTPPMGLRFRLKDTFDISGFSEKNQVILKALKKYGMIMADNGGDWFLSGAPDPRWDDDELGELKQIEGRNFEAVDTGRIYTEYD
ncbi:hypothetical protein ACFL3V_00730 [Nanoarchaeota archaeon]